MKNHYAYCFYVVAMLVISSTTLQASDEAPKKIRSFLKTYCSECHGGASAEGDFELVFLKPIKTSSDAEYWQLALDNLHLGEMPPETAPQPKPAELRDVTAWIEAELGRAAALLRGDSGEVVLRRLNRTEFEYTVEDLFGVRGNYAEGFPEDAKAEGFRNNGAALMLSAEQIEQYWKAAEFILDRTIVTRPKPDTRAISFTLRDIREREEEKKKQQEARRKEKGYTPTKSELERQKRQRESGNYGSPYFPDFGDQDALIAVRYTKPSTHDDFRVREPGWYHFAVTGYAVRSPGKSVRVQVLHGDAGKDSIPKIADVIQFDEGDPQEHEYKVYLQPNQRIWLELIDGTNWLPGSRIETSTDVAVAIRRIEMEGPILEQWPPRGHRMLLGERDALSLSDDEIPAILSALAPHLFRRPVDDSIVADYISFYREIRATEGSLIAFKETIKGMMASPMFLYHVEPGSAPDSYALANRLSYFLWRSAPDSELLGLAALGKLRDGAVLTQQVQRLLASDKSERFLRDFTDQWLHLDEIGEMQPDSKLYPEYDSQLEVAMIEETRSFIRELLRTDEPLINLIDSEWAMLNDRIAQHYGISGVKGNDFRRVRLNKSDTVRGGLLTQASFLNLTSNGTTTSPVVRGVFVLDQILGTPAPPPPPDVPPIEPDIRGASTIQEQLAKHREITQCNNCHRKIDPYGIALENFDVIGGWRASYRALKPTVNPNRPEVIAGKPVESNDTMPRHGSFSDFREFRELLKKDEQLVHTNMARKLATFALGRSMTFADEQTLTSIAAQTKSTGGLRTMIKLLVTSELFQRP